MFLGGGAHVKHREYTPLARDLDGKSELEVSTYPVWFPGDTARVPFLYRMIEMYNAVNFQMSVPDARKKVAPNSHVENIRIHSISVKRGGGEEVVMISGVDSNFWIQGNPDHD